MTPPSLLGAVPDLELADDAPGSIEHDDCQFAGWECARPAEVEVVLPDTGAERRLCRGHVGFYMLASTSSERPAEVLVRRLAPLRGVVESTLVRRAS